MKKLIALIVMTATLLSASFVVASAGETKLTTTVPDASYTLNIPANQEITFGATTTSIGNVTVTDSSGFAWGKNLEVTLTYDAFKADGVQTTIPYTVCMYGKTPNNADSAKSNQQCDILSGSSILFKGQAEGSCAEEFTYTYTGYLTGTNKAEKECTEKELRISVASEDWGKALAGDYSSVITFTAAVVVEND